jgi:hypothetical protein
MQFSYSFCVSLNLCFKVLPLFILFSSIGTVDAGYFVLNFWWHFFRGTYCGMVLQMKAIVQRNCLHKHGTQWTIEDDMPDIISSSCNKNSIFIFKNKFGDIMVGDKQRNSSIWIHIPCNEFSCKKPDIFRFTLVHKEWEGMSVNHTFSVQQSVPWKWCRSILPTVDLLQKSVLPCIRVFESDIYSQKYDIQGSILM